MGQWPQIMVTMDADKMHQNVAFPERKFQNFLQTVKIFTAPSGLHIACGEGITLPTPHSPRRLRNLTLEILNTPLFREGKRGLIYSKYVD